MGKSNTLPLLRVTSVFNVILQNKWICKVSLIHHTRLTGSIQSPFQYDNTLRCPYELVLGASRSLGDVAICVDGHVKKLFFCTRIDIRHVKEQIFHKRRSDSWVF